MKGWKFKLILLALVVGQTSSADAPIKPELPQLPDHLRHPFADITDHKKYSSAEKFEALMESYGYKLEVVRKTQQVPQVFALNVPPHMAKLPVPQKISTFIRLLLPNVVKVNEDIEGVRAEIIVLQKKSAGGETLTDVDSKWLAALGRDYGLEEHDFDELLKRVDSVPVSMVLAQGIDESGWGTSYFAIAGNALFGEHLASEGGKFLLSSSGNVKVAAFDNIYHSTASYIHNLNATRAYASFRDSRHKLRQENKVITGHQMVQALSEYSSRGQAYVDDLRSLIRHHELDSYDRVALGDTRDPALVSFSE